MTSISTKIKLLPLAMAIGTTTFFNHATAQDNSDTSMPLQLEEVIVTAQKRSQSLQEIPMSVSAIGSDALSIAGTDSVEDIQHIVPSLNIYSSNSPAQSSIQVRGAGTGTTDATLEPSVGVFIDNVFMPRSVFGLSDLVDIDRVEVLKGPQGTLYGKNTNSGVISVHTKGYADSLELEASQTFGNFGQSDTQISVAAPLSDSLGFRISGRTRERDGYLDNVFTGSDAQNLDSQSYRGQIFWEPNQDVSVRTIGYYSLSDGNPSDGEAAMPRNPASLFTTLTNAMLGGNLPSYDINDREIADTRNSSNRLEVKGGSIQVEYDHQDYTLTSISAYQEWEQDNGYSDTDYTPIAFNANQESFQEETFSQELRIASAGGDTVDWLAGLYYFSNNFDAGFSSPYLTTGVDVLGGAVAAAGDQITSERAYETESVALFSQAVWNITDNTALTMGLRYSRDEKDFDLYINAFDGAGNAANSTSYTGGAIFPIISGVAAAGGAVTSNNSRTEEDVTGMISLSHFVGDQMLYASVANSSKSGGFNGAFGTFTDADREYEPEETINYEVGAKLRLWENRAQLNLAYFYTEYTDFQTAFFVPARSAFEVVNAERQVTQGVELESTVLIAENLTLNANLTYLDARFRDFASGPCGPTSGKGPICDKSDSRMASAPNWAGSLSASYVHPIERGEIYAHGSLSFKTEHAISNSEDYWTSGYREEVFNATIGWRDDNWEISLWGKNLTDDVVAKVAVGNPFASGVFGNPGIPQLFDPNSLDSHRIWFGAPRTFGLTVKYSWH